MSAEIRRATDLRSKPGGSVVLDHRCCLHLRFLRRRSASLASPGRGACVRRGHSCSPSSITKWRYPSPRCGGGARGDPVNLGHHRGAEGAGSCAEAQVGGDDHRRAPVSSRIMTLNPGRCANRRALHEVSARLGAFTWSTTEKHEPASHGAGSPRWLCRGRPGGWASGHAGRARQRPRRAALTASQRAPLEPNVKAPERGGERNELVAAAPAMSQTVTQAPPNAD